MAVHTHIKILLVEDSVTMRKMELKILKQLGFDNILEAVDGDAAIDAIQTDSGIQLIISDWAMPNKDGYELLTWLKSRPEFKHLPLIMATGQGDKEYVSKALQAGAIGVVAKPFTPDELNAKIEAAFGIEQKPASTNKKKPRVNAEGKVMLKIAHIQITDHLTLGIMKDMIERGNRSSEYFDLETLCMPGWNPVQSALEQGDVDAAFILAPTAMDLFNYGVPIKLVMFAHRNGSILVRSKAEEYRKPYQQFFKHKTLLIPHKMSVHNMLAHMYFTQMGLKPGLAGKDAINLKFDVVPPVKMPEFLADNIESCGFIVAEPIGSRAIAAGIAERQFLSSEIWDNHPCCVAVFRDEFIAEYPDAVQEFCSLLTDAGRFITQEPDQAAEIAVSFLDPEQKLGLKVPVLKKILTDPKGIRTDNLFPVIEDLDAIQRYMVNEMGIGRMIDLETFVDMRFADHLRHAQQEGRPDDVKTQSKKEIDNIHALKTKSEAETAGSTTPFSASEPARDIASRQGKYLTFKIADESYGIGILDVREIIGMVPIRSMPQTPEYIKGAINLRGKVIPIIDMRLKFGIESADYTDRTCIIVVEVSGPSGSTQMGIVVDKVLEVTEIKEDEIQDSPQFNGSLTTDYILGMAKKGDSITILLDIDRVLHTEDRLYLAKVA
ncbi:MAG: chemotaxis protein CheW [Deltaproteobacteria bacterium]|nr:chemotaxis protein CheW [Deltaproteobacteria bacterium]